jgi:bacteriocin biosynthesis cyclodehydratase domain-containing protein
VASAVRVMPAAADGVTIVSVGQFGARVSEMLAAGPSGRRQLRASEITAAFATRPTAVVLALWRLDARLCERADELSFSTGTRWLPVIMEHPVIRIGPLICPPAGPCFGCYLRRRGQHDSQPGATAALRTAYEGDDDCGPGGYLSHHARMAAAVADVMLGRQDAPAVSEVTTIRLLRGSVGTNRVIACHGCPRCGDDGSPDMPDVVRELSLAARGAGSGSGIRAECREPAIR